MILIDTQKEEFSKLKDVRIFGRVSHEGRYNGNLLVIGLGGVGSKTVFTDLMQKTYWQTVSTIIRFIQTLQTGWHRIFHQ